MPRPPTGKRATAGDGSVSVRGKAGNGEGSVYFREGRGIYVATIGLIVVVGAFLGVHLASPSGMGYGDVRLAALTGTAVAYGTNESFAVACAVVAAAASEVSCLIRQQQSVPFAAFVLPIALVTITVDTFNR
jgi:prepilin signal peptidase PulO-like enzyme (type II secretory pathway)